MLIEPIYGTLVLRKNTAATSQSYDEELCTFIEISPQLYATLIGQKRGKEALIATDDAYLIKAKLWLFFHCKIFPTATLDA